MKSKLSTVRTGSWAILTLAGLACLASACSSSTSSSGSGGTTGSGGAKAAGGSGMGGSAAGGTTGSGGSGTGGATDAGTHADAPGDTGASVDAAKDAIVVRDGSTNDAGQYVRAGWTAVAMPDHVPANMTNPPSNESLASSNAFDGMNGTRWGTGVFQDTLTFPLYFTVDMKQVLNIGRITLYAGSQDTGDYPGPAGRPGVDRRRDLHHRGREPPAATTEHRHRQHPHQPAGGGPVDPAQGDDGPAHDQPPLVGNRRDERLPVDEVADPPANAPPHIPGAWLAAE